MSQAATGPDALRIEVASVEVEHLVAVATLAGVAITFASGRNGPGTGSRRADATSRIAWKEPGSATWGAWVDVSAGGAFVLPGGDDPDAYVRVAVDLTYLPTDVAEHRVLMEDGWNNGGASDDVTAAGASAGDVETYTVTVANDSPMGVHHVTFWIDAAVSGIEISDNGADWVNPTTEGTGLVLGYIGAGLTKTLHVRRTIGAASESDADVLTHLADSFTSYSP